jgi:hypothetical protein
VISQALFCAFSISIGLLFFGRRFHRHEVQVAHLFQFGQEGANRVAVQQRSNIFTELLDVDWESETKVDQKYGKIVDMDEKARQAILFHLTDKHNIFSLGRFATWRNILLDDVAADLPRIEKMMMASDYMRNRIRYLEN